MSTSSKDPQVKPSAPRPSDSGQPSSPPSPEVRAAARTLWRSLEHRAMTPEQESAHWRQYPVRDPALDEDNAGGVVQLRTGKGKRAGGSEGGVSRRRFFGIMGASAAMASSAGCARKPVEHILPFNERPEDLVPGNPLFYATAYQHGTTVEGLVVETQDGRPTKIEGNPKHPQSQGSTTAFAQASVLDLYDPDRTRAPIDGDGAIITDEQVRTQLTEVLSAAENKGGQGLALVVRYLLSPIQRSYVGEFKKRFPQARVFLDDPLVSHNAIAAAEALAGAGARVHYHLDQANVIFAADSDFLLLEEDTVRLSKAWARGRRKAEPMYAVAVEPDAAGPEELSRLYVAEPHLTATGTAADHRLAVSGSKVGHLMIALAKELTSSKYPDVKLPPGATLEGLPAVELDAKTARFVEVMASDLADAKNKGKSAILVGYRQPVWVHQLGYLLNSALGNTGHGLRWRIDRTAVATESLEALAEGLHNGAIETVVCLETNPAYDAPAALDMTGGLEKAKVYHFGLFRDETAQLESTALHVPISHYLEAWGDLEASGGTITICQPLIEPLHGTRSATEYLAFMASGNFADGYSLLRGFWQQQLAEQFSMQRWRRWLHDGIVSGVPREPLLPQNLAWDKVVAAAKPTQPELEGVVVEFHLSPTVLDGRFANNAWMQELPHPVTKLTWDNAAYIGPALARELGVETGDYLTVTIDGRSLKIPAFLVPAQAPQTVSITIGHGRNIGVVSNNAGFEANAIQPAGAWWGAAQVGKAGGSYPLASTQDYGLMKPPETAGFSFPERPIALSMTLQEFQEDSNYVNRFNLMEEEELTHLWEPPKLTGDQQWGMTVDLTTCTGCNACVIACQAENNIPTVGKKQVLNGREMHWMRIDRYYSGEEDQPEAIVQPMFCQHCEAAPCETVCPVAATVHSPEGLNDMAYNRCIGTRYCSNNCPYKVRRYNFFNYNIDLRADEFWNEDKDGAYLRQMQKNPDVTIRFRGVMEKCTYCVQRIQKAKIEAHVAGKDKVPDGAILTACQQVCPTDTLVFGDITDETSTVHKIKNGRSARNYSVLHDLNTHPRTTYLARVRNPHPELVKEA